MQDHDDRVEIGLSWSGQRRRQFLMARWRAVVAAAALVTAAVVGAGGRWLWRLYHPTMNWSNTPELVLDVWAQRRELSLSWRACDDADLGDDGWHLCRMSVAGAPTVEIWCSGDGVLGRKGCTFELAHPWLPAGFGEGGGRAGVVHGRNTMDPKHPTPKDTAIPPIPAGAPTTLTPDPNAPPEQGGGIAGQRQGMTPDKTGTGVQHADDNSQDANRRR